MTFSDAGLAAGVLGLVVSGAIGLLVVVFIGIALVAVCVRQEQHDRMLAVLDRLTALVAAVRGGKSPND